MLVIRTLGADPFCRHQQCPTAVTGEAKTLDALFAESSLPEAFWFAWPAIFQGFQSKIFPALPEAMRIRIQVTDDRILYVSHIRL